MLSTPQAPTEQTLDTIRPPPLALTHPHPLSSVQNDGNGDRVAQMAREEMIISEPVPEDVLRLRGGGGCFNCCIGRFGMESGPCVCTTKGTGILTILACLVVFPINLVWGAVLGLINCLLCDALGACTCVLGTPTPRRRGVIANPGEYK